MSMSALFARPAVVAALMITPNVAFGQASAPKARPAVTTENSSPSHEIPKDKIWSNRIPGTRDIYELEPNASAELNATPARGAGRAGSPYAHATDSSQTRPKMGSTGRNA